MSQPAAVLVAPLDVARALVLEAALEAIVATAPVAHVAATRLVAATHLPRHDLRLAH
jgi:hypothetical protein